MVQKVEVGDIVKMLPKYYGPGQTDQWNGITGIVLEIIESRGCSVLAHHPDDPVPIPVFAFLADIEKLEVDSGYCDACECDPCDCDWGN